MVDISRGGLRNRAYLGDEMLQRRRQLALFPTAQYGRGLFGSVEADIIRLGYPAK